MDRCRECRDLITDELDAVLAADLGDGLCNGCRWRDQPWWWRAVSMVRGWLAR